jgi:hypothetical protein
MSAPPLAAPTCVESSATITPQDATALAALRQSVETGPLYLAAAAPSGVATCRIDRRSGATALEYRFRDGGWLRAQRDARIEYTEQQAGFASPPAEPALALLSRAEAAAFGAEGCGFDWRQPETQPVEGEAGTTDAVYRGDVCNCQARVRRDRAGRVVGLALKSSC